MYRPLSRLVVVGGVQATLAAIQQFPANSVLVTVGLRLISEMVSLEATTGGSVFDGRNANLLSVTIQSMSRHPGEHRLQLNGMDILIPKLQGACRQELPREGIELLVDVLGEIIKRRENDELNHNAEVVFGCVQSLYRRWK